MPALRFLVAWLALACLTPSVSALPYDAVVIYGDSLSDNGNLFAVTTAIGQPLPPAPLTTMVAAQTARSPSNTSLNR